MDRAAWIPWAWGAGAAFCFGFMCLLQPWRRQFRCAWTVMLGNRTVWLLPLAAVVLERVWQWKPGEYYDASAAAACLRAGDSLAAVLTWPVRGEVLAMLAAGAFFANSGGLRTGLLRGIDSVFGAAVARVAKVLLLGSATASLGIPAVRFGSGGEHGRTIIPIMSSLWFALAATLVTGWLLQVFEAHSRAPEKAGKIRWMELAAQYVPRLWFMVLACAVAFPLMELLDAELGGILRIYIWPVVLLLPWFAITALRTATADEIHTVFLTALRRWWQGYASFFCWLAVAGVSFFMLHWITGMLVSLCPQASWWWEIPSLAGRLAWVWLAVWMLGAWVCIQVDKLALPAKEKRTLRRPASV